MTQDVIKELYEIEHSFIANFAAFLGRGFCRHQNSILIQFKTKHSHNPAHKNTSLEYQMIKLRPEQQYFECLDCRKKLGRVKIYDAK